MTSDNIHRHPLTPVCQEPARKWTSIDAPAKSPPVRGPYYRSVSVNSQMACAASCRLERLPNTNDSLIAGSRLGTRRSFGWPSTPVRAGPYAALARALLHKFHRSTATRIVASGTTSRIYRSLPAAKPSGLWRRMLRFHPPCNALFDRVKLAIIMSDARLSPPAPIRGSATRVVR